MSVYQLVVRVGFMDVCHRYLVSVGKGRAMCLYQRSEEDPFTFNTSVIRKDAHARIIWDCCWTSGSSNVLVTVSRDGLCKVWSILSGVDSIGKS